MAERMSGNIGTDFGADPSKVSGTLNAHLLKDRLSEAEVLLGYAIDLRVDFRSS